jgi:hypothetical protein
MSHRYARLAKHDRQIRKAEHREAKAARKAERRARALEGCIGHESAEDPTVAESEAAQ